MLHLADRDNSKARRKRLSFPIRFYQGANGGGKTLMMMHDAQIGLNNGREALSSTEIYDFNNPRPCDNAACKSPSHPNHPALHPGYVPLTSYKQMLSAKNTDIILDEAPFMVSSRQSHNMPLEIETLMQQIRKPNNTLAASAPDISRCDVVLRQVVQAVTHCQGMVARKVKVAPGEPPALWRSRSLILARTYSADKVDASNQRGEDFNEHRPMIWQFMWRPGLKVNNAYNTYAPVAAMGFATESGTCINCLGTRPKFKCTCG